MNELIAKVLAFNISPYKKQGYSLINGRFLLKIVCNICVDVFSMLGTFGVTLRYGQYSAAGLDHKNGLFNRVFQHSP